MCVPLVLRFLYFHHEYDVESFIFVLFENHSLRVFLKLGYKCMCCLPMSRLPAHVLDECCCSFADGKEAFGSCAFSAVSPSSPTTEMTCWRIICMPAMLLLLKCQSLRDDSPLTRVFRARVWMLERVRARCIW